MQRTRTVVGLLAAALASGCTSNSLVATQDSGLLRVMIDVDAVDAAPIVSALESAEGVHSATLGDSGEIVVVPDRDKVVDFRTLADTTEAAGLARVSKMRVWAVGRVHNVAITRARIPFSKHPTRNLGIEPRIRIRGWPKYHPWHGHSFYDEQEFIANVDLSTQPPELLQLNG